MPTYVYQCNACEKKFEVVQRMSDPVLTTCACGESGRVERMLTPGAGVIFKGSGFYETDYKRSSGDSGSKSESSKPAAKSESAPSAPSGGCGAASCCQVD